MASSRSNPPQRYPLESNHRVKLSLIRELAQGKEFASLARKYEVTRPAVQAFAKRHAEEIADARENLQNEFHGLWIADKANRLAEYERDVTVAAKEIEKLLEGRIAALVKLRAQDGDATHELEIEADISEALGKLARVKHRALRQSAEELGHLPSRVQVNIGGRRVNHILEGVDPNDV